MEEQHCANSPCHDGPNQGVLVGRSIGSEIGGTCLSVEEGAQRLARGGDALDVVAVQLPAQPHLSGFLPEPPSSILYAALQA